MQLKVEGITKYYGNQKALDEVSFEAGKAEILALLGPNGAGKSTMMKIIGCFLPQSGGKVGVCGYDINTHALEVKRRIGYLPEHNPLYPDMFVREYLGFVASIHGLGSKAKSRVEDMIEIAGLQLECKKRIGALSKGYRQRVGLAQALIHDPPLLILDEPTSGLDPNQLAEIRSLIRTIGKEKTVIFSTHIMQEVEAVCDRVVILHQGRVMADAPTKEIHLLSEARSVIRVEFDRPIKMSLLSSLEGVLEVTPESDHAFKVFAGTDRDLREDIFHLAVRENFVLLSMSQSRQSIEEAFRIMTL